MMTMGQPRAPGTDVSSCSAITACRQARGDKRARERELLCAHLHDEIIPGLEQLADPSASRADLLALADRQSRRLRAQLERPDHGDAHFDLVGVDEAAAAQEREWVRGHLHDTALQILEFIAGDGFGSSLAAAKIAALAGGAARDLQRWVESLATPDDPELLAQLELITQQARSLDPRVELVVGAVGRPPTGDQVEALAGAVREAVTNARKHAQASHVVVRVDCGGDGRTAVTVTDDGVGFDLQQAGSGSGLGLGLKGSILGRMRRIGGDALLEDAPGGGTRVTLVTPRQGA